MAVEYPQNADVVVIGAGIVGNSLVFHLAELGWREIVLVDKGPLPNPGGSTGHASNFIFPVDHAKEMTQLTQDSVRQYTALGVFTRSGGIEVARTPARVAELQRRMASATAWGEPAELLDPAGIAGLVPYIDPGILLAGFHSPGVGVVDPLRAGTLFRERAAERANLRVLAGAEVVGIETGPGRLPGERRVRAVRTTAGDIAAPVVAICCGVWSPRIARMAGARIPLTPAVHQMISVGPVPLFAGIAGEIGYPIVRDMDTNMYERQHGGDLEIGSYAHRPILLDPDDIPSIEEAALSPTELPFTQEDFDPQLEQALELMPELLGDERVGVRHAINGLLALTPDGLPVLGETNEVRGLWSVAAVWVKEAPGVARMVAEWMTDGVSEIDGHASDVARFYPYARTTAHVRARAAEGFNKTYGIVHPAEQWASSRDLRLSPVAERTRALGAVCIETAGWERPNWYESNRALLAEYADRVMDRPAEWDARWWSPIINAEHLALRERAGLVDLSAFAIFDVYGPGALEYLQGLAVAELDVPVGRVVYTPLLTAGGGFKADLTIFRLGERRYRVVTGGATGHADRKWFVDHLPDDGSVHLVDRTSAECTLGLWGPRAREILAAVTPDDVSNAGLPFGAVREIAVGPVPVLAVRVSYVGELGWELYTPMEHGARLWDAIWDAGRPAGLVPVGIGVYGTTARLEKCYRAFGVELDGDYDPVEAGLARPRVKEHDFVGRAAYLKARAAPPAATLCALVVDDHRSSDGTHRYMLGHEPVLTPDGEPVVDAKGRRSYVTSAGSGPSLGKHILLAYLPPELAEDGRKLAVEYVGDRFPVTVAAAGNVPLYDPRNERIRS